MKFMNKAPELASPFTISAKDVRVHYKKDEWLKGVSLQIKPGELIAFTGKNGSGKSTFMNALAGKYRRGLEPSEGDVFYDDLSIYRDISANQRRNIRRERMAVVAQNIKHSIRPGLSVEDNLRFMADLNKQPVDSEQLADVVAHYGLAGFMKKKAGQLSGGQQQLIPIAGTELTNPDVYFMDEPMAALDADNRDLVNSRLSSLSQMGKTVVYVSHEMQPQANRIVQFEQGLVVADSLSAVTAQGATHE